MKCQEVYEAWKEKSNQIEIRDHFTDDVMEQVYQYKREKRKTSFDMSWLADLISAHPLAQAALVAVGAMTGFIRLVLVILVILNKGDING